MHEEYGDKEVLGSKVLNLTLVITHLFPVTELLYFESPVI